MKNNLEEVKTSVYAGMSIFDLIKDYEIKVGKNNIFLEDKKYLSLYLGLINTKNSVTEYLKNNNVNIGTFINFRFLDQEEYIEIYNNYFVDIVDEIDFNSISNYLNYLLSKKVVKEFNESNGYNIYESLYNSNKQLVKTIK